jgi:predicted secreted protein
MANAIIGNNVMLYKHDDDLDIDIPFACMRNCDLSIEIDEKITTSQTSAYWEKSKPNIGRWTIEGDGLVILNDQYNYLSLLGAVKNRDVFSIRFVIDNGSALGLTIFSGNVWINSLTISSPYEDLATYAVSLKGVEEYTLSGTSVTPGGVIIISGSPIQVKQSNANEGQTTFTFSGVSGLDLVYASRGASVIAPIGAAGDYNSGITWDSSTGTATIYIPATEGESLIFLIQ